MTQDSHRLPAAGKTGSTTILIADDHPLFRHGLRDVIEAEESFHVVAEVGDGEAALEAAQTHQPHVAVLDLEMPKMTGLETAKRIADKELRIAILILTMYDERKMFDRAVDLGVRGYLLKDSAALEIVKGIMSVARGEYFFSPALTNHLIRKSTRLESAPDSHPGIERLTRSERAILGLIAANQTTEQIAGSLHISPRTVEHHRKHICEKLELSGAYALVRFALQNRDILE